MNKNFYQISGGSGPKKIIRFAKKTTKAVTVKTDHNYVSKKEITKTGATDSSEQKTLKVPTMKTEDIKVIKEEFKTSPSPPNLCRTCLQIGDIPIYGKDNNISEELMIVAAVTIKKDDALPKYICESCHSMLQGAIQLRIAAQYSEQVLLEQAVVITEDNIDLDDQESDTDNTVPTMIGPSILTNDQSFETTQEYTSNKEKRNFENIKSVCHSIQIPPNIKVTLVSKKSLNADNKTDSADMADKENNVTMKHLAANSWNNLMPTTVANKPTSDAPRHNTNRSNNFQHAAKSLGARKVVRIRRKILKKIPITDNNKIIIFRNFANAPKIFDALRKIKHKEDHQRMDKGDFYCQRCKINFKTGLDLKNHKRSREHRYFKEACETCQKLVPVNRMRIHIQAHENNVLSICHICGEEFTNSLAACQHKRKHVKPSMLSFKCSLCPYRCKDERTLTLHTRTHTGEKPYQCSQCAKQFATSSNMYRHILVNHKTREITCNVCNARFWRQKDMVRHVKKIHYGEKPHKCNMCEKQYGDRKTLNTHERRVHKRERRVHSVTPLYLRPEFQEIAKNSIASEGPLQDSGTNEHCKTTNSH